MFGLFKPTKKEPETYVTVSNRTVIRVLLLIFSFFVAFSAIQKASHALTMIFISLFLALSLNAPVSWLSHKLPGKSKGSRSKATAVSFIVVMLILGIFIASIVPSLVKQTSSFLSDAPGLVEDLRDEDSSLGRFVDRYNLEPQVDKFSSQLSGWIGGLGGSAFGTVTRVSSNIFSALTVLVITFMMLIEGPRWIALARRLMPDEKEPHAERLAKDMYRVIKGYVNGQVLLAAIASVMVLIPLLILGVSYPVALMVIVFICGLIPLVGHTIGAVIVSFVALFESPVAALIMLVYYIVYQQIENYAVQPKVQANSTDMSPLLVFISVIIGVSFNGLLGGLVAIPVAGCIRILIVDYLYSQNYLSSKKKG